MRRILMGSWGIRPGQRLVGVWEADSCVTGPSCWVGQDPAILTSTQWCLCSGLFLLESHVVSGKKRGGSVWEGAWAVRTMFMSAPAPPVQALPTWQLSLPTEPSPAMSPTSVCFVPVSDSPSFIPEIDHLYSPLLLYQSS